MTDVKWESYNILILGLTDSLNTIANNCFAIVLFGNETDNNVNIILYIEYMKIYLMYYLYQDSFSLDLFIIKLQNTKYNN